ncbi:MAG: hypothetical protein ACMG6E_06225 [Candidatus Roizmanbacteria bacterium]
MESISTSSFISQNSFTGYYYDQQFTTSTAQISSFPQSQYQPSCQVSAPIAME